ncbi:fumarylacetoacetate hydrolase family protein [Nocardioides litoris]|uniref:fumarylacetoacetate hydrolase family protein n=1 Tax=Nocardioides litoris TaxID=1926648 RepID=UPI00111FE2A5|nr:fumarylacetoacetate hydrolase family protein [Nocardioides litoris]
MSGTTGFGIEHLPYGVFSVAGGLRRVGVRLADGVLDLAELTDRPEMAASSLNPLLALGPQVWRELREQVVALAESGAPTLPLADVVLHLPVEVADYVDFYASEHHATRVGEVFRPDAPALPRAWKHLPIGYHGRAGTVVVSGTPVVRPSGVRGPGDVGPSQRLDLEAELGYVVGVPSPQGTPVAAESFADHVFGVVGLNDWSARDLQAFETVPLGPFLGKSFATSVSAWVTPLAALDAAWCDLPSQDPRPADHLAPDGARGLDLTVEVEVAGQVVATAPHASTYWGPAQMLAHLTSNGASLRVGDLFASGTISGPGDDERGCLLELTWGGRDPWTGADGRERTWLEDGDEVVLRYTAPSTSGGTITLGEVRGEVLPAR